MNIGRIDLDKQVLVIAEIGLNHEGDFALAEKMVRAAARGGAHAVKFQTIVPEKLVSPRHNKAAHDLFTRFQFSRDQFRQLKELADREGVMFLSTPFDVESAEFLDPLVPAFKIASGDNNFWPLIETVARSGKPLIVSTGMSDLAAVRRTKDFVEDAWRRHGRRGGIVFLHCVSLYPTPPERANLMSIAVLREALGTTVGYSDHTIGVDAAVLAVALGARVIEKHFTLDKKYSDFPDHPISMDPADLELLCRRIVETERMLGAKTLASDAEQDKVAQAARRSIVARSALAAGQVLRMEDLDWVRPAGGLAPGEESRVLGRPLKRALQAGEQILPADVG